LRAGWTLRALEASAERERRGERDNAQCCTHENPRP
jgi:hypothetical protein